MNKAEFRNIKYFSAREVEATGANIKNINSLCFMYLSKVRGAGKCAIKLSKNGVNSGKHSKGSRHYPENCDTFGSDAIDWKWDPTKRQKKPTKNQTLQMCLNVGFKGIGIYSTFFHTDCRGDYALWTRKNGKIVPLVK